MTIKQIATVCEVSEQAIRAWCRKENIPKDRKGSYEISESVKEQIFQKYRVDESKVSQLAKAAKANGESSESSESSESCGRKIEDEETIEKIALKTLIDQLATKDEQIRELNKQIGELNARLCETTTALMVAQETAKAAQALHAGTMQQQLEAGKRTGTESDSDVEQPEKKGFWSRLFGW